MVVGRSGGGRGRRVPTASPSPLPLHAPPRARPSLCPRLKRLRVAYPQRSAVGWCYRDNAGASGARCKGREGIWRDACSATHEWKGGDMVGRLDWKHTRSATRINTPKLGYQTLRASRAASRAWRHVAPPSSGPRRYHWRRHTKVRTGLVSPSLARLLAALLVSVWLRHRHISSPSCLDSNCAARAHLSNAHVRGWSARAPTRFPPTLDRFGCATLRT